LTISGSGSCLHRRSSDGCVLDRTGPQPGAPPVPEFRRAFTGTVGYAGFADTPRRLIDSMRALYRAPAGGGGGSQAGARESERRRAHEGRELDPALVFWAPMLRCSDSLDRCLAYKMEGAWIFPGKVSGIRRQLEVAPSSLTVETSTHAGSSGGAPRDGFRPARSTLLHRRGRGGVEAWSRVLAMRLAISGSESTDQRLDGRREFWRRTDSFLDR